MNEIKKIKGQVSRIPKNKKKRSQTNKVRARSYLGDDASSRDIKRFAAMLDDPCNAELVPGFFGSRQGIIQRFRRTHAFDSVFTGTAPVDTHAFVVWFPDFHSAKLQNPATNDGSHFSAFQYGTDDATVAPTLVNFGNVANTTAGTAHSLQDPCAALLQTGSALDARTISACITAHYSGPTSSCQGTFYKLTNIPFNAFTTAGGTLDTAPTIDQLIRYSDGVGTRLQEQDEIKFRPSLETVAFRGYRPGAMVTDNGAISYPSTAASAESPMGIGFVLSGVDDLKNYRFDFTKIAEWRPDIGIDMPALPPRGMDNPSMVASAVNFLDRVKPGWQTTMARTGMQLGRMALQNMVLGGAGRYIAPVRNAITW